MTFKRKRRTVTKVYNKNKMSKNGYLSENKTSNNENLTQNNDKSMGIGGVMTGAVIGSILGNIIGNNNKEETVCKKYNDILERCLINNNDESSCMEALRSYDECLNQYN